MTNARPVEEGHFGMILTKEEAALIMALRHVPGMKIGQLLYCAEYGKRSDRIGMEHTWLKQILDIYEIKTKEGLGVTI